MPVDPLADAKRLTDEAMGPCVVCNRQLLATELPIFFRISAQQCGLDKREIDRHVGLANAMGGGQGGLVLASVLGPGVKPVVVLDTVTPFNVCHRCATDRVPDVLHVIGIQWERDRRAKGLDVPSDRERQDEEEN